MNRITQAMLEARVRYLNELTGNPIETYTRTEKGFDCNIGNYHLDYAYGGVKLVQVVNDGGGIKTIIDGYGTKRELWEKLNAFIDGVALRKGKG